MWQWSTPSTHLYSQLITGVTIPTHLDFIVPVIYWQFKASIQSLSSKISCLPKLLQQDGGEILQSFGEYSSMLSFPHRHWHAHTLLTGGSGVLLYTRHIFRHCQGSACEQIQVDIVGILSSTHHHPSHVWLNNSQTHWCRTWFTWAQKCGLKNCCCVCVCVFSVHCWADIRRLFKEMSSPVGGSQSAKD